MARMDRHPGWLVADPQAIRQDEANSSAQLQPLALWVWAAAHQDL
jgi:hypothetical protein